MKKIAFICVHNSCRSQIAEALGKKYWFDRYDVYSCGTERKPQINQDAVRLMKQLYNIDMEESQFSKLVQDIPAVDVIISMGCDVGCPYVGKGVDENWQISDPTGKDDEVFKRTIKEIEEKVKKLNY